MEEQNGAAPTFESGAAVDVEGHGASTFVEVDPQDDSYCIVDTEAGQRIRVELSAVSEREAAREGEEETVVAEPPSVFEQLGKDYSAAREDRREDFPILPGRFHGNLVMRAKPVDPIKRKKKVRRIAKTGINDEVEARYAAEIIAEACDCILVRLGDGEDPVPAHLVPDSGLGDEPVRFDHRLGKVVPPLGEILTGSESPAAIVRLLFKGNLDALDAFYVELDQWLKEASPTEGGDEEDGEGADRPS